MAQYVDGFVLPLPKKGIDDYRRLAKLACKVWMEHGALDYRECIAEDLKNTCGISFAKLANLKAGETVVFAWITFKSRAHRDKVNAKVMKDPRLQCNADNKIPFDFKRMAYGGFETLIKT